MTLYARSDVHESGSPDCGGHSLKKDRKGNVEDKRLVIECVACEQHFENTPALKALFSTTPETVPLTDRERHEADRTQKDSMKTLATLADSMVEAAGGKVLAKR